MIEPKPEGNEREAILVALDAPRRQAGPLGGEWAETALREAVSTEVTSPFTEHDVCSLW